MREAPLYIHKEEIPLETREVLSDYDPLSQQLLFSRGITSKEKAQSFFAREYAEGLHDPFLLPDMEVAVDRILSAIAAGEKIAIFSDYDCDGIPGGVLLHDFFKMIGFSNFCNYIPHRHEEGYGLSREALVRLKDEGATLVITIDCGITDVEEVAYASESGLEVIVTDHHEPGDELPAALAVINPKRKDSIYPFDGLCGTGVAFKLVTALIAKGNFSLSVGQEKWLLDLVGIATVADMVPLLDENRIFAHYGLLVMRKGRRIGLQHLFRVMKTPLATLTEDDIGFMIAPRINAASRMGSPEDAFKLLSADNEADAGAYARHLDSINNERKGVVAAMVKEVRHKLSLRSEMRDVLVIGDPKWRPSLVGLVANTLKDEFQRPVFVWGRDGKNVLKGSCRSDGKTSVVDLMRNVENAFLEYGGHHMSGGFAVKEECIHTLSEMLNDAYHSLVKESEGEKEIGPVEVDAVLSLSEVSPKLVRTLSLFAPYGMRNEKPIFLFKNVVPTKVEIFGKQKAHTKILFTEGSRTLAAIGFFMLPSAYAIEPKENEPLNLLAHLEESFFMGRSETRLRIVAVFPAVS